MERYCIKCGKLATKENDSLFMCEAGHENWINPALGVSVYVIKDSKVLFGVRSSNPGKGKLDVPGGFVDQLAILQLGEPSTGTHCCNGPQGYSYSVL